MYKYITDTLKNNLKSIIKGCTRPEQKAVMEVTRGLITEGTPIKRTSIHPITHVASQPAISATPGVTKEKMKKRTILRTLRLS